MSDVKVEIQNGKGKKKIWDILFALILFAFPFLHINTGLDIADTTYNLLNFASFPHMNQTWAVSTVLANLIGHGFSLLPFGNTMLGMNIYCTILGSAFILAFYCFLRKKYPALPVFLGLLIAEGFCWCPRVILYHYLSYFLFCIGALLLLAGIRKNKTIYYLLAGGVLALNVFVRFPNIVEASLIIVLFYYGISQKKNIVRAFLCCVGGYLLVALVGVLLVSLAFERTAYPDMIHSLFGMTKEATSYTPKSMLKTILGDYLNYVIPLLPYLGIAILGVPFLALFKKIWVKILTVICMGIAFVIAMRIEYYYGIFNFNFMDYRSIYMWGVFLLMMAICLALKNLFDKNVDTDVKLFGLTVLFIIFVTPIGSNNGLYTALNNLFFPAVFVIGELTRDFRPELLSEIKDHKKSRFWWGLFSFRALGLMFAGMAFLTGLAFGVVFVFRDASFIQGEFATVTDNPVIKGIRTDADHAKDLQEINDYLNENQLKRQKAISFGFIPGVLYVFEEECALTHSWPDLDSFPTEEFISDLEGISESGSLPLVFSSAEYKDLTKTKPEEAKTEKQKLMIQFLLLHGYRETFRNGRYVVYRPGGGILAGER